MDVSKEYIQMCQEATKYMPIHHWRDGDFYYDSLVGHYAPANVGIFISSLCSDSSPLTDWIVLYRQDQIQELFPVILYVSHA